MQEAVAQAAGTRAEITSLRQRLQQREMDFAEVTAKAAVTSNTESNEHITEQKQKISSLEEQLLDTRTRLNAALRWLEPQ